MMNRIDVETAVENCASHPVLGPAAKFLNTFKEAVDDQSDGWTSWPLPGKASAQLQELLSKNTAIFFHPLSFTDVTLADVEKTLAPIKRMVTSYDKRHPGWFKFDVDAAWKEAQVGYATLF